MNEELRAMLADLLGRVDDIEAPLETKEKLKRFISETFEEVNKDYGHDWLYEVWADDALSSEMRPEQAYRSGGLK